MWSNDTVWYVEIDASRKSAENMTVTVALTKMLTDLNLHGIHTYIHTYIPETINHWQCETAKDTSAIPSGRTRTGGIQGRRHAATGVARRDILKLANPPLICVSS